MLTREAFEDYLDHLTPEGAIFFTRPQFQIPRLVSTAREVFTLREMGPIDNHVFAFSEPDGMEAPGRLPFEAGFLLKKSEFLPGELQEIREILKADTGSGPDARTIKILYAPDERPTDSLCAQIVGAPQLEEVLRKQQFATRRRYR